MSYTITLRGTACVDYDEDTGSRFWVGCSRKEMEDAITDAEARGGTLLEPTECERVDEDSRAYWALVRLPDEASAEAFMESLACGGNVEGEVTDAEVAHG